METSHAKRIFSDNVTCFGKNKSCSNRNHLQECLKCSSLLACKAPRAQISICFPSSLSRIHLAASLLCSPDCFQDILFEQAGNSHWKKLAFLRHVKWHICSVGEWKYFPWSLNTSSPIGFFFGKNKSCSNRSHLQECLKCSSLLACKAPRAQLSICFPTSLSHIHLTASLLCPADCF